MKTPRKVIVPGRNRASARRKHLAAKPVEYNTAEEIQAAFRMENEAQRHLDPLTEEELLTRTGEIISGSTIKARRSLRDKKNASKAKKSRTVEVLRAKQLEAIPWLVHGFSTRTGGVSEEYGGEQLNLGYTGEDSRENVDRNRELFLREVGAATGRRAWPLVNLHQIHSPVIYRIRKGDKPPLKGDGLITSDPGLVLAVKVADCVPVIVADRAKNAVGVFHAGWRGTAARIVQKGVGEMRLQLGCKPENLVAAIGPAIGSCCYEIGDEVETEFETQFAYSRELFEDVWDSWSLHIKYPLLFLNQRAPGHGQPALSRHLNLIEANRRQLLDAGLPPENIEAIGLCTACNTDKFFSYRRERVTGRMMAAVGIR